MKRGLFVVILKSTLGIFAVDKCLLSMFFESEALDIRCVHCYNRSAQSHPYINCSSFKKFFLAISLPGLRLFNQAFFVKFNFLCVNPLLILCD